MYFNAIPLITGAGCWLIFVGIGLAAPAMPGQGPDCSDKPTVKNDEFLELGYGSTGCLRMEAEAAVRSRRFDRAIQLCRRALSINNDDIDLHRVYAEALSGKLEHSREPDAAVYKECVRQWLLVMRNQVGEEKGLNINGAGGLGDFLFQDEELYIQARQRLLQLTGTAPRPWETNKRYLERVLKPAGTVRGRILKGS